jgi:hypothetical protein
MTPGVQTRPPARRIKFSTGRSRRIAVRRGVFHRQQLVSESRRLTGETWAGREMRACAGGFARIAKDQTDCV